jgi:hypothetical protein
MDIREPLLLLPGTLEYSHDTANTTTTTTTNNNNNNHTAQQLMTKNHRLAKELVGCKSTHIVVD